MWVFKTLECLPNERDRKLEKRGARKSSSGMRIPSPRDPISAISSPDAEAEHKAKEKDLLVKIGDLTMQMEVYKITLCTALPRRRLFATTVASSSVRAAFEPWLGSMVSLKNTSPLNTRRTMTAMNAFPRLSRKSLLAPSRWSRVTIRTFSGEKRRSTKT